MSQPHDQSETTRFKSVAGASVDLFPLPSIEAEVKDLKAALQGAALYGIHALAYSGKDEAVSAFVDAGMLSAAFGLRAKAAAQQVFGLTDEQTWLDAYKEIVIERLGMTPREIFQRFATEVCQEQIDPDIWVRAALRDLAGGLRAAQFRSTPYTGAVLQDVRFESEAAAVRAAGGVIIHMERDHKTTQRAEGVYRETDRGHTSEQGVSKQPGEPVIYNNGTLEELGDRVRDVIRQTAGTKDNKSQEGADVPAPPGP